MADSPLPEVLLPEPFDSNAFTFTFYSHSSWSSVVAAWRSALAALSSTLNSTSFPPIPLLSPLLNTNTSFHSHPSWSYRCCLEGYLRSFDSESNLTSLPPLPSTAPSPLTFLVFLLFFHHYFFSLPPLASCFLHLHYTKSSIRCLVQRTHTPRRPLLW